MGKSVTIIISHYESLPFLRRCVKQIHKHTNPDINHHILIADQSLNHEAVAEEFMDDFKVDMVHMKPLYSGYGIDWVIRNLNIDTDYICQLHVDAFPINDNWLKMPITLMEENDFKFTRVLQFVCDKPESIYPYKNPFFAMAQCFNIGKTEVYKEMSLQGGFTRFHNRPQADMLWLNTDWSEWAKEDYQARGSDDDVPAFYWEDTYREHDKMSFGLTGRIGVPGEESGYGTIIEDMLFHFGFCRESVGVMPQMGEKYREWTRRINENYDDALLDELLAAARSVKLEPADMRRYWSGKNKVALRTKHGLNKRIEELKK